jgi:hypothetical protein
MIDVKIPFEALKRIAVEGQGECLKGAPEGVQYTLKGAFVDKQSVLHVQLEDGKAEMSSTECEYTFSVPKRPAFRQ